MLVGHAEAYSRNFGPHADHFWFVAIDMLGHGWTDKPAIDYQVRDYADHVLAVLKNLGRDKAMMSGESLGGWVATYLAVHRPAVVEKLVLNTAGGWTAHPQVMARLNGVVLAASYEAKAFGPRRHAGTASVRALSATHLCQRAFQGIPTAGRRRHQCDRRFHAPSLCWTQQTRAGPFAECDAAYAQTIG
jgi:pimeloyl-ACP methyl ester carboxylesterase